MNDEVASDPFVPNSTASRMFPEVGLNLRYCMESSGCCLESS